jgi:uncharacterized membrane protein
MNALHHAFPRRAASIRVDVASLARALVFAPLLAFVPGYAWIVVLAPQIRGLARLAIGIVLSIALVMLALFGGSVLLHARVSGANAVMDAVALTLVALAVRARAWMPKRMGALE